MGFSGVGEDASASVGMFGEMKKNILGGDIPPLLKKMEKGAFLTNWGWGGAGCR